MFVCVCLGKRIAKGSTIKSSTSSTVLLLVVVVVCTYSSRRWRWMVVATYLLSCMLHSQSLSITKDRCSAYALRHPPPSPLGPTQPNPASQPLTDQHPHPRALPLPLLQAVLSNRGRETRIRTGCNKEIPQGIHCIFRLLHRPR